MLVNYFRKTFRWKILTRDEGIPRTDDRIERERIVEWAGQFEEVESCLE